MDAKNPVHMPAEPTELCSLGVQFNTDKSPFRPLTYGRSHNYTPYYHQLFEGRRNSVKKVLEIGVAGGGSLRMWENYFPAAEVYGIDNNPDYLFNEGRIKTYLCDQNNEEQLRNLMSQLGGNFDLILDDGSHEPSHQILSVNILMSYLAPDGIYIIEDVCHPHLVMPYLSASAQFIERDTTVVSDDCLVIIRR